MKTCLTKAGFIIGIFLILGAKSNVMAQSENITAWANIGLGKSNLGSTALSSSAHVQYGQYLLSLRTTKNDENQDLFSGDVFWDFALLFGLAVTEPNGVASVAIGISRVSGSRFVSDPTNWFSGGSRRIIDPVIGLPIEGQIFVRFGGIVGLGIYVYGNINSEKSFGGLTFNLQGGKLR